MSGPLSPLSLSAHNRIGNTIHLDSQLKIPLLSNKTLDDRIDKTTSIVNGPPSSPFQTEVEQDNLSSALIPSPSYDSALMKLQFSPVKSITVHEDDIIDDSLIIYSSQNSPLPQPRSQSLPLAVPLLENPEKVLLSERVIQPIGSHDCAPPQSVFEVDYSNIPRREDYSKDLYKTPTVVSDDTCFSTFSAIPNTDMTVFANIGNFNGVSNSPRKQDYHRAPIITPQTTPRQHTSLRSSSPTPRRHPSETRDGDTTNLLLDFTQQFEAFPRTVPCMPKRGMPSPTRTNAESDLLKHLNHQRLRSPVKSHPVTPSASKRSLMNLLDFDLPPQPTPRSVPSISIRELESLKSSYLSEISSLKASLDGREAEVESLKKAVADAERRVGEALEIIREERCAREHAEKEKLEWEKKGKEVETVLQSVKDEFESAEREREDLIQKLEESNRDREAAELRAAEVVLKPSAAPTAVGEGTEDTSNPNLDAVIAQRVSQQLDEKMESLARELHAVYKKKHESKVATLRKTYEARSEKKCCELQQRVDELSAKETCGCSGGDGESERKGQEAEILRHRHDMAQLMVQVEELKQMQGHLMRDLHAERAEKGDLVAAVDEMLALQADSQSTTATPTTMDGFRKSIGLAKPSSLRAPIGHGPDSRTGKMGGASIDKGGSAKSRMMHNIERMGGGRME